MFEKCDLSNRQKKRMVAPFSFTTKFGLVFVLTLQNAFSLTFHLTKRAKVLLENCKRDFQNNSLF